MSPAQRFREFRKRLIPFFDIEEIFLVKAGLIRPYQGRKRRVIRCGLRPVT
jgi:hypothetical protein